MVALLQGRPTPHLFELSSHRCLLRPQRGLDAVEQAFEPADELRLCDAKFRLGWRFRGDRLENLGQLLLQGFAERLSKLFKRSIVNRYQSAPTSFVQGRLANLLKEGTRHRSHTYQSRRLCYPVVAGTVRGHIPVDTVDDLRFYGCFCVLLGFI